MALLEVKNLTVSFDTSVGLFHAVQGIDLSVAAIMVLMSVIMGQLAVNLGVPAVFAVAIGFAGGTLAGA